ncbi:MAG: glycerate kinase [Actinomycetota bacterium]|nr:glycerate kinase [Actinomycetota bacterium]
MSRGTERLQIPARPLVATQSFGPRLPAARVAAELARGLLAGGLPAAEVCPICQEELRPGEIRSLLDSMDFDRRMRRARAVIIAASRLAERDLEGSAAFEIATRARQAGVPAYAVTAEDRLGRFDARILDLQAIVVASSARALAGAGRRLARLI